MSNLFLTIPLVFFIVQHPSPTTPLQTQTKPPCILSNGKDSHNFICRGLDDQLAQGFLQVLNQIAASRLDPAVVLNGLGKLRPETETFRRRRLTDTQKKILIARLSPSHGSAISVISPQGDNEAELYAEDFMEVFRTAGWTGVENSRPEVMVFHTPVTGLLVMVSRDDVTSKHVPAQASTILRALKQSDIPAKGVRDAKLKPGEVNIVVGTRPAQ